MIVGVGRIGPLLAAIAATMLGVSASAQGAPSTGPLTLPETLRGTVQVPLRPQGPLGPRERSGSPEPQGSQDPGSQAPHGSQEPHGGMAETRAADTLKELYPILAACWEVPQGLARFERTEITARFSLRRDGSVIGTPRVTFSTQGTDTRAYRILTDATLAAIRRCTPARITPGLGAAIAGRPIALRFIYQGPKGQGV